jgi:hypothetical protein
MLQPTPLPFWGQSQSNSPCFQKGKENRIEVLLIDFKNVITLLPVLQEVDGFLGSTMPRCSQARNVNDRL